MKQETKNNLNCDKDLGGSGWNDLKWGIIIGVIICLIWFISAIVVYKIRPDWGKRGQFGDMFGGINSLFSGLAFAGLIYTIILQRKELTLQRKELILTRNELMRSAKAQEESEKSLTAQLKSMVIAANINGLTTIIDYYKRIAAKTKKAKGRAEAERKMGNAINDIANYMDEINKELENQRKKE
jgi:CRISPR/Cas system CMR-associated protein Cmr5 small subunit